MTVRQRLHLGFAALIGLSLLVGVVAVAALQASVASSDRQTHAMADLATVEGLRYHAEQVVSASRGFLLTATKKSSASFEQARHLFLERLRALRGSLDSSREQRLAEVERAGEDYLSAAERAMRERSDGQDAAAILAYVDVVMRPARDALESALDRLVQDERTTYRAAVAASERADRWATGLIGGATLLAIMLSLRLALSTTRRIAAQFEREQQALLAAQHASEAREEILNVVSHDLRNPLGAILMISEVLKKNATGPVNQRRVAAIASAAQRMRHLIEEVLASASLEAGTFTLAPAVEDIGQLFQETGDLFQRAAEEKAVRLAFTAAPDARVFADRERLLQVLANLVGNALKFTPEGGEVLVGAEAAAGGARFFVKDSGPGIPPEAMLRLFERHWQARRGSGGGLGLGLYIAKQIVDLHGGRISVDSRPGAGATFTFTIPDPPAAALPLSRPPASDGEHAPPAPPALH